MFIKTACPNAGQTECSAQEFESSGEKSFVPNSIDHGRHWMSQQRRHSSFPAIVPPEKSFRTSPARNGTQNGSTIVERSVGDLALRLEHESAAEIPKGKGEINVGQLISHFTAKTPQGKERIAAEESGQ